MAGIGRTIVDIGFAVIAAKPGWAGASIRIDTIGAGAAVLTGVSRAINRNGLPGTKTTHPVVLVDEVVVHLTREEANVVCG